MKGGLSNVCVFSPPRARAYYTRSQFTYIAGGATYEEATKVAELNASGGVQVVLGGSYVHNSGTFLEDLDDAFGRGGV